MGGIAIISFLDSSPASKFALLENHWLRAWQSSSSFSESQMSPSGPSPLQWTRYCVFFPQCLLSTILSMKNSFCPSIKMGLGGERACKGKSVLSFSLKGLTRAFAFMGTVSEMLFSMHVQIRCLPFNGGGALTEVRLASDESKRLLSAFIELPRGNTVATKLLSDKKDLENCSVMAATIGGQEDFTFMQRVSCSMCVL